MAGALKKMPLATAVVPLIPPVSVTRMVTWPVRFHRNHTPLLNADAVRVSRTAPPAAFRTSILSTLPVLSQSSRYKPTSWELPSVRFTSKLKFVGEYQVEAIRSVAAAFCKARTSVVDDDQE